MAYVRAVDRERQIVAAAISVLSEVGVPGTTLRAVAAAAQVPLGTLYYVFPTKDQLLKAVIVAVIEETSAALRAELELDRGIEHALRHGISSFWHKLIDNHIGIQVMQYELIAYSVRAAGHEELALLLYESYSSLVTDFCRQAAEAAGERCAVEFDVLGRLAWAQVDGLILQYATDPDRGRAARDLAAALDMIVLFAAPRRVTHRGTGSPADEATQT
ncbi:TetR/AcrR family transcriptional regulator [Rhodococcus sp. T2V]|uniref:TetR/AcrR family transcriptional regulator n=1 Tax=Rhodococcus sp. T2V TaxID=3034164 RepID=UPI0023E16910|nr:TetR/AcrR family transcriptional regulator [Rhodococcus sp. T2V]MDF3309938.1 TetR/AcrR family transcriptional regulator [Rhodococcus sp. T2V]